MTPIEFTQARDALLSTPIASESDAQGYLFGLWQLGLDYHPEDNAHDLANQIFTPDQADLANLRMEEVFAHLDDPCAYLLDLTTLTDRS